MKNFAHGTRLFTALLVLLGSMGWIEASFAQRAGIRFAAEPSWVEPLKVPLHVASPEGELNDGAHVLLFERQLRVVGTKLSEYHHIAVRVVHARGVETHSTLSLRFSPEHESLIVHQVKVHRGDEVLERLQPEQWRQLQRETRMESLVFDGSVSATAVLPDIRVGDVIEYSFSRDGSNPVFGGRQFGVFDHRWSMPVARAQARLLWPAERPLRWHAVNGAPAMERLERGAEVEYRWSAEQLEPLIVDSQAPPWHDPYPASHWSEYADWNAVARWATPLYVVPPAGPRLRREAALIATLHGEPEQRLLAALRFVQKEVRYLAMFMGTHSHAPNPPDLVLQRRFGDCKDKSRLLLALLKELDIPADAALVNTRQQRGLARWQPMPIAFDHVLVRAQLGDRVLWLDPTNAPQLGRGLDELVQADHGLALLVRNDSEALVPMAPKSAQRNRRHVELLLDASAGYEQPATISVTTIAEGRAAEALRHTLATQAHAELLKKYAAFYAQIFEGLVAGGALEVRDDAQANALTMVERYRLPQWWQRNAKQQRLEALVSTPELQEWLQMPATVQRQSPYGLVHPYEATHVIEVRLHEDFRIASTPWEIRHPAFSLSRAESWPDPRTLRLVDHYVSQSDEVAVADLPKYLEQLRKARGDLSYVLFRYDSAAAAAGGTGAPHWVPLLVMLSCLGLLAWLLLRVLRWDPAPAAPQPGAPSGLSGWLLLPALGMISAAILTAKNLMESWPALQSSVWLVLTDATQPNYHPATAPFVLISAMLGLGIVVGMLLSLWLYLRRRTSLPSVFISVLGLTALGFCVDLLGQQFIPAVAAELETKDTVNAVRGLLYCAVWAVYFRRSGRVANTFTRRLKESPAGSVQEQPA